MEDAFDLFATATIKIDPRQLELDERWRDFQQAFAIGDMAEATRLLHGHSALLGRLTPDMTLQLVAYIRLRQAERMREEYRLHWPQLASAWAWAQEAQVPTTSRKLTTSDFYARSPELRGEITGEDWPHQIIIIDDPVDWPADLARPAVSSRPHWQELNGGDKPWKAKKNNRKG